MRLRVLLLACSVAPFSFAQTFQIMKIDPPAGDLRFYPRHLGDDGSVSGVVYHTSTVWNAIYRSPLGVRTEFPGQVAVSSEGSLAIYTDRPNSFLWNPSTGSTDLGHLPGRDGTYAKGMNAGGEVVGAVGVPVPNGFSDPRAFKYSGGLISALGELPLMTSSDANDINGNGVAVGTARLSSGPVTHPVVRWLADGTAEDLGGLSPDRGNNAIAISESGYIAGNSYFADDTQPSWFWSEADGFTLLPVLAGTHYTFTTSVNSAGQVVGFADTYDGHRLPFIWSQALGTINLNDYLGAAPQGWTLLEGFGNEAGQFAGVGFFNGSLQGYIANPVPEPGTVVILVVGLGLARCRKRRPGLR